MNVVVLKPREGRTLPLYPGYFEAFSELLEADGAPRPQQFAELMAQYDTEVVS